MTIVYLLYIHQTCYTDEKKMVGIYSTKEKAREAAQILMNCQVESPLGDSTDQWSPTKTIVFVGD